MKEKDSPMKTNDELPMNGTLQKTADLFCAFMDLARAGRKPRLSEWLERCSTEEEKTRLQDSILTASFLDIVVETHAEHLFAESIRRPRCAVE